MVVGGCVGAVQNIFSFNKTEFVISTCTTDSLFAYSMILNEGQERYRGFVGGR